MSDVEGLGRATKNASPSRLAVCACMCVDYLPPSGASHGVRAPTLEALQVMSRGILLVACVCSETLWIMNSVISCLPLDA